MAYIKPLPEELFDKLKEDIEKTTVNEELILEAKDILANLSRSRKGNIIIEEADNVIDDNKRLLKLLTYSNEAINYWYDNVDCEDDIREENEYFKKECAYFISKLSLNNNE